MAEIELSLEGPHHHIGLDAFLTASGALAALLRGASADAIAWQVEAINEGSLHMTVAASHSAGAQAAVRIVGEGLGSLHRRASIPLAYTPDMVRAAGRLAGVVGEGGVTGASVRAGDVITRIDEALAANARDALAGKKYSIGAVRGVLTSSICEVSARWAWSM